MTLLGSITLFLLMAAMAALPSSSVALTVARSAMFGVPHGIAVALGIVVGDLIFIAMAILGMTALAETMGALFVVIKYAAAAYLIWFGLTLVQSQFGRNSPQTTLESGEQPKGNILASFGSGLLLTLGDVKAILFYASLLPTFVDLAALSASQIFTIALITIVSVGGVKIVYAIIANTIADRTSGFIYERQAKIVAGGLLMTAGGYLALKA